MCVVHSMIKIMDNEKVRLELSPKMLSHRVLGFPEPQFLHLQSKLLDRDTPMIVSTMTFSI